jgi:phosphoribosylamine--glycine ligase
VADHVPDDALHPRAVDVDAPRLAGRDDGDVVTAGGRVLNVTGIGSTAAEARQRAYDAAELIGFEGRQMRTDIADRAVEREMTSDRRG